MHTEPFTDEPGQELFAVPSTVTPSTWDSQKVECDEPFPGKYLATVDETIGLTWWVYIGDTVPTDWNDRIGAFVIPNNAPIQVIPATANSPDDCCDEPNHVNFFLDVQKLVTHGIYEADGITPINLTGMNLFVCVASSQGATIDEVVPALVSSNTIQWLPPEIVRKREDLYSWSLRNANDGDAVVAFGNLNVQYAARRVS